MQGHKIQFCPSWSKIHCTLVGIMNMPVAIAMIKIFSRKIMRCSVNAQSLYSRAGEKSRFSFKSQCCRYILIPDCKNEKIFHLYISDLRTVLWFLLIPFPNMDFNVKVDSEFKVFSGDMQLLDSCFDFLLTLSFIFPSTDQNRFGQLCNSFELLYRFWSIFPIMLFLKEMQNIIHDTTIYSFNVCNLYHKFIGKYVDICKQTWCPFSICS